MERKQHGEKRQSDTGTRDKVARDRPFSASSLYLLPRARYEYSDSYFSFSMDETLADKGWKMFMPSRGNTWLLGIVYQDDVRILDGSSIGGWKPQ